MHVVSLASSMNPRSAPTRAHILSHFPTNEWAEDDAWDSTSDSESPRQSTLNTSFALSRTGSSSPPNLAFSYTHLNAPNPSSYPPKETQLPKNGWTIVRTSHSKMGSESKINLRTDTELEQDADSRDVDVEGDMILGDLEAEMNATDLNPSLSSLASHSKPKNNGGTIRQDIDDIVNGIFYLHPSNFYTPHLLIMQFRVFSRSFKRYKTKKYTERSFPNSLTSQ